MLTEILDLPLGVDYTGVALKAQLQQSDGTPIGDPITTGYREVSAGSGDFVWSVTFPDETQRVVVVFMKTDDTYIGKAVFNPSPVVSGGGGGTGSGDILVDHNYGGADAMRVFDDQGVPVDNAEIRAYVAADLSSGIIDSKPPSTMTGSDGRWIESLSLDPDNYTITVYNPITKRIKSFSLTVEV